MNATFDGDDYYINLSREESEKVTTPLSSLGGFKYPWIKAEVRTEFPSDIYAMFTCTNNSRTASFPGRITLDKEDERNPDDITVRVFAGEMLSLLKGEIQYIMTRYDGYEKKVWLFVD